MFDDIQALEKEIEEFRHNILATQEFVSSVDKMIIAMKDQSKDYSKSYEEVLGKLQYYAETQKAESGALLVELANKNDTFISDAVSKLNETQQELIAGASNMIDTIKAQNEELSKKYEEVLDNQKANAEKHRSESEVQLLELEKKNEAIITEAVAQIKAAQKEYIARLDDVETSIKKSADELTSKYQQFVEKLESTNLDQIYSSVQDMKKSINIKLAILLSGVGVSIILTVLALLFR